MFSAVLVFPKEFREREIKGQYIVFRRRRLWGLQYLVSSKRVQKKFFFEMEAAAAAGGGNGGPVSGRGVIFRIKDYYFFCCCTFETSYSHIRTFLKGVLFHHHQYVYLIVVQYVHLLSSSSNMVVKTMYTYIYHRASSTMITLFFIVFVFYIEKLKNLFVIVSFDCSPGFSSSYLWGPDT